MDADNWALVTDLYELTMANGFKEKLGEEEGVFDIFFRKMPDDGSFVVLAGLEQAVEELKNFHFEKEDIDYLKGLNLFSDDFIEYLADFKFSCRVWAVPEGTPIFPREPVMTIQGPLIQAQLFETLLLSIINHETLIATKARRITAAAKGRGVMEFGARRAQGPSSATYGARAAVIGGAKNSEFRLQERWRTAGSKLSTANTTHSEPGQTFILTTARFWLIRMTCSNQAFRMPLRFSTN